MPGSSQSVVLSLTISADEYIKVYRGAGKQVLAHDIHGRSVRFPANILQCFVTRQGISGLFEIIFDCDGKYRSIRRLR